MRPYTRVYAEVNLDAIEHNMKQMAAHLTGGTQIIGVVKTDGYGHGAVPVAEAIDPYVCGYAVATVEEAVQLRRHGIAKPVLILGVTHKSHNRELVEYELRPAVFMREQAESLSKTAVSMGRTVKIHLALDTGMSRIGMAPDGAHADMVKEMSRLPGLDLEGIFTHFAKADETDKTATAIQIQRYREFLELLHERGVEIPVKHCYNSAGILDIKGAEFDAVRAGISMYGLYPSDEVDREVVRLIPAMNWKSFITYIKTVPAGTAVSYGGTYVTEKETVIATVPAGYGDGYPRNQSNKGSVLIRGRRAGILGRVCMDQMMVDVTDIPGASVDDEVTLMGRDGREEITAEDIAETCGGFHYEILCGIGKRVPRVYLRAGKIVGQKDYFDDIYKGFGL